MGSEYLSRRAMSSVYLSFESDGMRHVDKSAAPVLLGIWGSSSGFMILWKRF